MAQLDSSTLVTASVAQHLADHNQLHAKANYVFDVADFGATGDGSTDDTAAIQATIDAATAGSGVVFVPKGSYLLTDTLTVYSNTIIQGVSKPESSFVTEHSSTVITNDTPGSRIYNVYLRDIEFRYSSGSPAIVVDWESISNGGMDRVIITGYASSTGVKINSSVAGGCVYNTFNQLQVVAQVALHVASDSSNENRFYGCRFSASNDATDTGVYITDGNNNTFFGCDMENGLYGIRINGSLALGNTFFSPRLEGCTTGIQVDDGRDNTFYSPYFSSNTDTFVNASSWSNQTIGGYPPTSGADSVLAFGDIRFYQRASTPEGNLSAPPGSLCLSTGGGSGTSLYVKESGTGTTGWVGK